MSEGDQPAMPARQALLRQIADRILALDALPVVRVGIDGVDGAGKSVFGDELECRLRASGRPAIRASVDGFHHPRAVRYRQGRHSPRGYFHDSYDYAQLKAALLDPLSPGGSGRYRTAVFDHRLDAPVVLLEAQAAPGAILIFDGIFLHRPELQPYWDLSIFLHVGFDISMARMAQRDGGSPDPQVLANRRYVEGQELYLKACNPARHATITINNEDLAAPYIIAT